MNATEISALLAKAQLDDNRDISHQVVVRWVEILGPIRATLDEAFEALNMHRRESVEYLQPAHIITNLRRVREDRMRGHQLEQGEDRPPTFVPDPKPSNFAEMAAAWDDPVKFGLEVTKYRKQVAEYHRARRAA